jgi:hypothetical protein
MPSEEVPDPTSQEGKPASKQPPFVPGELVRIPDGRTGTVLELDGNDRRKVRLDNGSVDSLPIYALEPI